MTLRSAVISGGALVGASSGDTFNLKDSATNIPASLLTDIDDASVASPDANKWSPVVTTFATWTRLGFPTPTATLTGTQQFLASLYCTAGSPTTPAKGKLTLYEAAVLVVPEVSIEADITSTTGQQLTLDWDSTVLVDMTGADVQVRFDGTPGETSGTPINAVGINAIQWVAQGQE